MAEYIRNEQNIDRLFIAYIKIKYKEEARHCSDKFILENYKYVVWKENELNSYWFDFSVILFGRAIIKPHKKYLLKLIKIMSNLIAKWNKNGK